MNNWQTVHFVQVLIAGVGIGAQSVAKASTGTVAMVAEAVAIGCTAIVTVLGLYSGAALGPVAAETVRLKSLAPPPLDGKP